MGCVGLGGDEWIQGIPTESGLLLVQGFFLCIDGVVLLLLTIERYFL